MARTDNDSWDLATSVGATATMVASGRARATRAALIDDRFAEPLVRAWASTSSPGGPPANSTPLLSTFPVPRGACNA